MFRKLVALVAAPVLLVAACASEGEGDAVQVVTGEAAVSALQAAPDAVADVGTGKVRMVVEMTVMGEPIELVATGAYDADAQQMSMSMDMGATFEQIAAASGEEIPLELGDGTMEVVADGDTVYMRSSLFEMFAGTTGWLSLSAEDLGADAGSLGLGATTSDPTKILESLRGVTGEPRVVGQEDVHGVATTHYRATMSLADALAEVPESQRDAVEAALEQLGEAGDAEVPVDVWIDGEGLPRRMTLDMGATFGAIAGEDASATMTIELSDYGEPVDIEIPSADEVTPFSEVLGGLGGFGGRIVNERTIEVDGFGGPISLAVAEAGTGGRPLLLVHGFTGAKDDFTDYLDPLADMGWHAVAPDQRGHGGSAQPDEEAAYTFEAFAADLFGLLDALGWQRCVALGHSMGGMVVQTAILEAPDRFEALILMDTSHRGLRADPELVELGVAIARTEGIAAVMAAQDALGPDQPLGTGPHQRLLETREGYREFGARKMLASSPAMYAAMLQMITAAEGIDRLPDLPRISVPTLVLVGEEDTPFRKPSQRMAEAIPGAELVVLPDGGHSPQFESPELWWKALSGFLDRL